MQNISIIGSGTMGNGIAHVFAQGGHQVTLIDISSESLEQALVTISKNLDRQVSKEKITEGDKTAILRRITTLPPQRKVLKMLAWLWKQPQRILILRRKYLKQ